jgi:hypothetical protein
MWTGMGLNMGRHGTRQADNRPRHGTHYVQNVFGEKNDKQGIVMSSSPDLNPQN